MVVIVLELSYIKLINQTKMGNGSSKRRRMESWSRAQEKAMSPIKEGVLLKQSKYLKEWRRRSVVLKSGHIFTFKVNSNDESPTAAENFTDIHSFVLDEQHGYFLLKITTKGKLEYRFKTKSQTERDEWYKIIKLEKHRMLKESIAVFSSKVEEDQNEMQPNQNQL